MTPLQIIIGKTVEDKLYFRVLIDGGRVLLTSRDYVHIEKCMNEIYTLQQYEGYVITEDFSENHGYQYTIMTREGRLIGTGLYYATRQSMRNDIHLLKLHIAKAEVIDTSPLIRFFRPVRIK